MAIKPAKPRHVVAIPYPAQGHINPMLQLCQQLVPLGFSFTFINTHHIHRRLHLAGHTHHVYVPHHDNAPRNEDDHHIQEPHHRQNADANHANHCDDTTHVHDVVAHEVNHSKGCSSIRMAFVTGGCAPEHHAHVSTSVEPFKAAQEMCESVEHLISSIMQDQVVEFIMSDILLSWSSASADKFGLPWVSFWPASAASLSACMHFSDLVSQGNTSIPCGEREAEEDPLIKDIPGLPVTRLCDVPKLWDTQGKLDVPICNIFKAVEQASCVLLNSFAEVEGQVLEALSKRFSIHAVGPLLPSRYMLHTSPLDSNQEGTLSRPSLFQEDSSCLAWLDKQGPSSVLFISFGSISLRSEEQLQELVKGVEASGCPFLLVYKPDIDNVNGQRNGLFTHEAGHPNSLIVPWAPQLQVLSHNSVGGFITHCGWNSVIESVSMGVPMICWADTGERMSNQRFVVDFWKCGTDMVADKRRAKQHIDDKGMLVGRGDVEKSVRFLMLEEGASSIRARAAELSDAAIKAYDDSRAQLNKFAQTMKHHLVDVCSNIE